MAQESPDRLVHIPTSCLLIPAAGLAANTAPGTPRQANCRPGDQRSASLCFFRGAPGGAVSLALVAAAFGATWISDSLKKWFHSQFEDDAKCRMTSSPYKDASRQPSSLPRYYSTVNNKLPQTTRNLSHKTGLGDCNSLF